MSECGERAEFAEKYFREAAKEATSALCLKSKCGAVIVLKNMIVGRGYNAPPQNLSSNQKCKPQFFATHKPNSDRTCCVHAEWRAILDAIRNRSVGNLDNSILYFTRVDERGEIIKSGQPYCTVCSRLALDVGISHFALWHAEGIRIYDTQEYNELSYKFHS